MSISAGTVTTTTRTVTGPRAVPGYGSGHCLLGGVFRSSGAFVFEGFAVGQERFEDCDAGLDFGDVSLQFGQHLPDLVLTRGHGLPSPGSSSASSADSSASLSATLCRWVVASAASARISAGVRVFLGLARTLASSVLISPEPGRLAARERTSASRIARSVANSMPCDKSP